MPDFMTSLTIRKFRCDACKHHLFSLNERGDMIWQNDALAQPVFDVNAEKLYWQDGDRVLIRCDKCKKINYPVNGALKLLKDEEGLIKKAM